MTTIVINENTEEGRNLMKAVRDAKKAAVEAVSIYKDELEAFLESMPADRIPGLAYTDEERIEAARCAEEDIAAGRVYTAAEVRARYIQ